MSKKSMRSKMIQTLSELDCTYKTSQETILYEKIIDYIKLNNIESVGVVLSMPHELNTDPLISKMLKCNVNVYNPICDYESKLMHFYPFSNFDEIQTDSKSIRIPVNNDESFIPSLIIVPGLIFSKNGYRIGYGGGFYDRYLEEYQGHTLSLAFNEQIGNVVVEEHDIPVDIIMTPTETIVTGAG